MKKLFIGIVFAMVCCVALTFTNTVSAAAYDKVTDITNTDTLHNSSGKPTCTITANDGNTVVNVVYNAADLKIIGEGTEGASEGRPDGYAWLGIRVSAPDTATKYKINDETEENNNTSFDKYFGVNKEKLEKATKEGKDITYSLKVTWLKNGGEDTVVLTQTINIIIKVDKINLFDKEDNEGSKLWDNEKYQEVKKAAEEAKKAEEARKAEANKKDEKDTTPKTGSVDYSVYMAIATAVVALGGIYTVKKLAR